MLTLSLAELERGETLFLDETVPPDSPLWGEEGLVGGGPLRLRLQASAITGGQVIVRGEASAEVRRECRRCLAPLPLAVTVPIALVFVPKDEETEMDEEADFLSYDPRGHELDLSDGVREEFLLGIPQWPLCREDCRGLCPHCGSDRNEIECGCAEAASDPRWSALDALKREE